MARPFHHLLADSLNRVEKVAKNGFVRSENISRRDRERLLKSGWLESIGIGASAPPISTVITIS